MKVVGRVGEFEPTGPVTSIALGELIGHPDEIVSADEVYSRELKPFIRSQPSGHRNYLKTEFSASLGKRIFVDGEKAEPGNTIADLPPIDS